VDDAVTAMRLLSVDVARREVYAGALRAPSALDRQLGEQGLLVARGHVLLGLDHEPLRDPVDQVLFDGVAGLRLGHPGIPSGVAER
jgi:hypothetical protein